ncbi:MAG TPA: hypothetical protein VFJ14_11360 [Nocardioidaceae bacterium]|nr:hypothetical protein [Nocardioidaceae bacterium]
MTVPQPLTTQQHDELDRVLRTADHCHGIVTRNGEQDACGKPPVAVIDGSPWGEGYWPACAYHANRYGGGRCVPLSSLARMLADERERIAREEPK